MDFLMGILCGMPIGALLYWLKEHKASLNYDLALLKEEMAAIHLKLEKILSSLSPR
jgi:hypothetical protein